MKKILLPFLLLPLLFFSCKKDSRQVTPVNTGSKKYAVQFNVGGFQQTIITSAPKSSSTRAKIASAVRAAVTEQIVLHYLVYDSGGNLIRNILQPSDSGKFATIKDSLAAGTYTVYFVAAGDDADVYTANYEREFTYPFPKPESGTGPAWEDSFTKALTLTVTGGNISQNVTLNRIVAELEVDLTGAIPSNAANMEIKVDEEYVDAHFDGTIDTTQVSYRWLILPMTTTTTTYDLILLNTIANFNVDLTAYDASGNQIAHALVNNVHCVVNERTVLTGALFGSQSNNFSVSLNDTWNANPYTTINF